MGSSTANTAFVAMAASTAEPPALRMSSPAPDASGCADATWPRRDSTGDRREKGRPAMREPPQFWNCCAAAPKAVQHAGGGVGAPLRASSATLAAAADPTSASKQ